jgi:3-deoxy-7-phosphoheptulonate synthase
MGTLQQIERLRYQIGLVQRNEAFLLHAGDCAESFDACTHVSHLHYLIVAPLTPPSASCTNCGLWNIGKYFLQNRSHSLVFPHTHLGCSSSCCMFFLKYAALQLADHTFKVRIGRIAGQYAKPRSSSFEKIGDREVLSFRLVIIQNPARERN